MPITVQKVGDVLGKDVFTDKGFYAGKISDLQFDLARYKVRAVVIETAPGSMLAKMIGGKKRGIIIPYSMVQAIGDVMIIKHITAMPTKEEEK
jgi:sporulation protein YlmC with PRC-barrel domain